MTTNNFLTEAIVEVGEAVKPLLASVNSETEFSAFLMELGWAWDVNGDLASVRSAFDHINSALTDLQGAADTDNMEALTSAVSALMGAIADLTHTNFNSLPSPLNQSAFWQSFPDDVLDFLIYRYLERKHPLLFGVFAFVGVLKMEAKDPDTSSGRLEYERMGVDWGRISKSIAAPQDIPADVYKWGGDFKHRDFMRNLASLLVGFKAAALLFPANERLLDCYFDSDNPSRIDTQTLVVAPIQIADQSDDLQKSIKVVLVAMPIPPANDRLAPPNGIMFFPEVIGAAALVIPLQSGVELTLEGGFDTEIFRILLRPEAVELELPPLDTTTLQAKAKVHVKSAQPNIIIGDRQSTRLEYSEARLGLALTGPINDFEYIIDASIDKLNLVLDFSKGDGFLTTIFGSQPQSVGFSFGIIWSNRKGLKGLCFQGGAGLETTLPIHKDLFGVLKVDSIYLALRAKPNIEVVAAATATVSLGPIAATVQEMGLQANLTFPEKGGNLGPVNLALGFKPPKGAGLAIDTSVVVGVGFLSFDEDKQQYAGLAHLEIAELLSVTAVGLITTKMPDGSPGFSLLLLITFNLPPIQLGYGFTLNGLGGLLGVNRTVAVDVLRNGLRTGTLGSVLFPADPVHNAARIVSDLGAVFPPAQGRFLFGPMAILGWGPKTLIMLEIGFVLELPEPVRLLILGRLRVVLPEEENPVVKLQLDSLGVIEFGSGDVSLDAVLYDSEIKGLAITGEMALRANFGAKPVFLLAVGGFHPAFQAPAGFPVLNRLAISLTAGDNPRLRLAAYMAITTNTVQFGALLELYVEYGGFSVEGHLGFDALIQFQPFGLVAALGAMVAIKHNGQVLLSVILEVTLTGPTPWHAWGKASFKFLLINVSVEFNVQAGETQPPPLPAPVRLRPLILAALQDPRNWGTQLPLGEHPIVVLREQPEGTDMLVHPLANLHVSQRVVPLDRDITRFGNTVPDGERNFKLGVLGAKVLESVDDLFAPAQFREMSDDEKLSAPAFESLQSGLRFAVEGFKCGAPVMEENMQYEENIILPVRPATGTTKSADSAPPPGAGGALPAEPPHAEPPHVLSTDFLKRVAPAGAAGLSTLKETGKAKYRTTTAGEPSTLATTLLSVGGGPALAAKPGFRLKPRSYAVVGDGGRVAASPPVPDGGVADNHLSYAAATELQQKLQAAQSAGQARLRVVPYIGGNVA
jgi:hypothetical protein